jgi:hypothetical protein
VPLRIEVDRRLWGYARAAHVDPDGGPWRFAVAHHLTDGHDGPITVALYVDGTFWTRVAADRPRPDLGGGGPAAHGFSVPHALAAGQQVEAWAPTPSPRTGGCCWSPWTAAGPATASP